MMKKGLMLMVVVVIVACNLTSDEENPLVKVQNNLKKHVKNVYLTI